MPLVPLKSISELMVQRVQAALPQYEWLLEGATVLGASEKVPGDQHYHRDSLYEDGEFHLVLFSALNSDSPTGCSICFIFDKMNIAIKISSRLCRRLPRALAPSTNETRLGDRLLVAELLYSLWSRLGRGMRWF